MPTIPRRRPALWFAAAAILLAAVAFGAWGLIRRESREKLGQMARKSSAAGVQALGRLTEAVHGSFPRDFPAPESRPLSSEETLKSFQLEPGLRIELVAAEPLIVAPVAIQWDASGRLWAVEMPGYASDLSAKDESSPSGRVVVLEDRDGDGRMDQRTVFLDGLVLPRALLLHGSGALVAEPPQVWFCPDADGNLKADGKTLAIPTYSTGGNPEHQPNGLLRGLDNWIYSAKSNKRYRANSDGSIRSEATLFRGQWGIAQDDVGRLYYNYNQDALRADLLPAEYLSRNPSFREAQEGVLNVRLTGDQRVYPGGPTPGVNREKELWGEKLGCFTSACGPQIYRGEALGAAYSGNAFVCEPAGNLIKRFTVEEKNGEVRVKDPHPGSEFLFSSSERFRPVNLANGPDGALYVVDMARGIVAHSTYVTPWLREQIRLRSLEAGNTQGRIWRISREGAQRPVQPSLDRASAADLVKALYSPNAWQRETAQRLLVERRDPAAWPLLEATIDVGESPLAALHALWTLEGTNQLSPALLLRALSAKDKEVLTAAIRLSEPLLGQSTAHYQVVKALASTASDRPQLQAFLSLGAVHSPDALASMLEPLATVSDQPLARAAVISGLCNRERAALDFIFASPTWREESVGRMAVISELAACIRQSGRLEDLQSRISSLTAEPAPAEWQIAATLSGIGADILLPVPRIGLTPDQISRASRLRRPAEPDESGLTLLPEEPAPLLALLKSPSSRLQHCAQVAAKRLVWPGKAGFHPAPAPKPLTSAEAAFVAEGKAAYLAACAGCHLPEGTGQKGLAPPLAGSEWVTGPQVRLIRIALYGLSGTVRVKGEEMTAEMPPVGLALSDLQVAQILSYIRQSWGNSAPLVNAADVAELRRLDSLRGAGWTVAELLQMK